MSSCKTKEQRQQGASDKLVQQLGVNYRPVQRTGDKTYAEYLGDVELIAKKEIDPDAVKGVD